MYVCVCMGVERGEWRYLKWYPKFVCLFRLHLWDGHFYTPIFHGMLKRTAIDTPAGASVLVWMTLIMVHADIDPPFQNINQNDCPPIMGRGIPWNSDGPICDVSDGGRSHLIRQHSFVCPLRIGKIAEFWLANGIGSSATEFVPCTRSQRINVN